MRFRVSYPLPLTMSAILWVIMWFSLAKIISQGGMHPRDPGPVASFVEWALCIFAALVGPLTVLKFSTTLQVDGNTLTLKRIFGLRTTVFQRAEIQSANLIQKSREQLVQLRLANGSRIEINRFSRNFGRLLNYLGLAER